MKDREKYYKSQALRALIKKERQLFEFEQALESVGVTLEGSNGSFWGDGFYGVCLSVVGGLL